MRPTTYMKDPRMFLREGLVSCIAIGRYNSFPIFKIILNHRQTTATLIINIMDELLRLIQKRPKILFLIAYRTFLILNSDKLTCLIYHKIIALVNLTSERGVKTITKGFNSHVVVSVEGCLTEHSS